MGGGGADGGDAASMKTPRKSAASGNCVEGDAEGGGGDGDGGGGEGAGGGDEGGGEGGEGGDGGGGDATGSQPVPHA